LLFPCRKCGALSVAISTQKTRRCPACNHANVVARVVVIKRFEEKEHALNALRLVKIPREERDGIPYIAGDSKEKRTTGEELKLLVWTAKRRYPQGITEKELCTMAQQEGLDVARVMKFVEKCKQDGTVLETGDQKIKFL